MTSDNEPIDDVLRRTVLKASAVAAGALGMGTATTAAVDEEDAADSNDVEESDNVDEPEGFETELLAAHAPFPDDVTATLEASYHEVDEPIVVELDDASTTMFLEARWEPGGTGGWHTHPGPLILNIVEGELEVIFERDCVSRTYTAGESLLDDGDVVNSFNPSETEEARAYVFALGIPDGEPPMENVAPVEC
ncbi:hypothetical protein B1756_13940 [Natrarchaeobaculum aegyptiacum]|uniref:Cupin n=2 Tax=Natrarchaeobaculum aegyptiacum TaxID=745377 RepID=A0A2Z2I3G2_9EURY|nr:hypothetical protein B1756_13940 [Natrarchaeobaculum aegyptiacum]